METASKLPLIAHCAYPDRDDVQMPRTTSPAATRGVGRHRVIECAINRQPCEPEALAAAQLDDPGAYVQPVLAWLAERAGQHLVETEVALAYDPEFDTARVLGHGREAYVNGEPYERKGTGDALWVAAAVVHVADWKTGRSTYVEEAQGNHQLAFLGLAAARAKGVTTAIVYAVHVDDDGNVTHDEATFGPAELAQIAAWLKDLGERRKTAEPTPGPHCSAKFCGLQGICPGTAQTVQSAVRAAPGGAELLAQGNVVNVVQVQPMSPAHAAFLLGVKGLIRAFHDMLERNLKAYSDEIGGIACGDGKVWAKVTTQTEEVELSGPAEAVLRAKLGEHADVAIERSTSKAAIGRAAKKAAPARGATALQDEIVRELRAGGHVKKKPRTTYEAIPAQLTAKTEQKGAAE